MKLKDGKFKILVLSDLHTTDKMPKYTRRFCQRVMEEENPDLIVLLGDNTAGYFPGVTQKRTQKAVDEVLSLMGDIPFAVIFGNHDHEGLRRMEEFQAKRLLLSCYQKSRGCLALHGDVSLDGIGNYRIPLTSSDGEEIFSLYFFDSGTYLDGGYSSVRESQIKWFEASQTGKPCIVFQHIIPEEIYSCFDVSSTPKKGYVRGQCEYEDSYYRPKYDLLISGSLKEGPCPGKINFCQVESWKNSKKVLAGVFGHDHVNDFDIILDGIRMLNCPSPSFYTYGNNRGVRVITLREDSPESFETKVIHYDDIMTEKPLNPFVNRFGIAAYRQQILPYAFGGIGVVIAAGAILSKVIKNESNGLN